MTICLEGACFQIDRVAFQIVEVSLMSVDSYRQTNEENGE